MGDTSIVARRLEGGQYVQYGWSGNGGYFKNVGFRLLTWYNDSEKTDYLFGLGQTKLIGAPGSEKGGESYFLTHQLTHEPFWLGKSEREIFSKIMFIDYGYFYDLDHIWYYVVPGPFRIKIPLLYIENHLDDKDYEFEERNRIQWKLVEYILGAYYETNEELKSIVTEKYPQGIDAIKKNLLYPEKEDDPCYRLWDEYKDIFCYFDDWVVVKTDKERKNITGFLLWKKQGDDRAETLYWTENPII